jgi:uncharacterized phage-like protein YoqJ
MQSEATNMKKIVKVKQLTLPDDENDDITLMEDIVFDYPREHTLCFSGHRPEKLPGDTIFENVIKSYIALEISEAVEQGFTVFIMGGSRGIDLWAGLAVIKQKRDHPDIKLIAALPYFEKNISRYSEFERFNYGYVLENCDSVFYACKDYNAECMKRRNLFMVEHSSRLVAFVRDYRSGTGQTIRLAEKAGIVSRVYNINDDIIESPEQHDKTEQPPVIILI